MWVRGRLLGVIRVTSVISATSATRVTRVTHEIVGMRADRGRPGRVLGLVVPRPLAMLRRRRRACRSVPSSRPRRLGRWS